MGIFEEIKKEQDNITQLLGIFDKLQAVIDSIPRDKWDELFKSANTRLKQNIEIYNELVSILERSVPKDQNGRQ